MPIRMAHMIDISFTRPAREHYRKHKHTHNDNSTPNHLPIRPLIPPPDPPFGGSLRHIKRQTIGKPLRKPVRSLEWPVLLHRGFTHRHASRFCISYTCSLRGRNGSGENTASTGSRKNRLILNASSSEGV